MEKDSKIIDSTHQWLVLSLIALLIIFINLIIHIPNSNITDYSKKQFSQELIEGMSVYGAHQYYLKILISSVD